MLRALGFMKRPLVTRSLDAAKVKLDKEPAAHLRERVGRNNHRTIGLV